jgi:hypothetical protein
MYLNKVAKQEEKCAFLIVILNSAQVADSVVFTCMRVFTAVFDILLFFWILVHTRLTFFNF